MPGQYRWSRTTESAELDGTWVIMNAEKATLTRLSGVGGYIWSVLQQARTTNEVVAGIVSEYEVARNTARTDVERFLQELLDIGAVEQVL